MNSSKKGFDLIQIVSIFLIIFGLAILVFVASKIGIFNTLLVSKNFTDTEKKYCNYAKKTLTWLDSKRDSNGKYFISVSCNPKEKTCNLGESSGQSGHDAMPIIWARYKYIQKTGDTKEISILKKDIDIYFRQLDLMEIQNNFWNCRLLLEMNDEKILGLDYVAKVNKMCLSSSYLSSEDVKNKFDEKTGIYPQVIKPVDYFDWQNLEESQKKYSTIDKNIGGDYSTFVTYPSDFVARYKYNQNKEDLNIANTYFNRLLIESYINSLNFPAQDKCLLAISSLDLYSVNQDQKYLDWAKKVYSFYFNSNGIKTEAMNINCALLNRELGKYDNDPKYQTNHQKLLDAFISKYLDGGNSPRKFSNDGSFFVLNEASAISKDIRQNALIVNLLCQ